MASVIALLAYVIPVALGSALSPTLFLATTAFLSRAERPRVKALAFLVGAVVSLLVWTLIVYSAVWVVFEQVAAEARSDRDTVDIVLGCLLLLLAVFTLRPVKPKAVKEKPKAEKDGLWAIAGFGALMQGRDISSIVLFIAALQHIASAQVPFGVKPIVTGGVIAITTLSMWLPILAHVRVPQGFEQRMTPRTDWLRAHQRKVVLVVCLVFGVYLITRGLLAS